MPDLAAPGTGRPPVPAQLPALAQVSLRAPVFISDLHLCAQRPATLECFLRWVAALDAGVAELVILGDLFEFWAGDDTLGGGDAGAVGASAAGGVGPAGAVAAAGTSSAGSDDDGVGARVADALAALAGRGTAVYLLHGNRDVLLGAGFLARSRAQLLADPTLARIGTGTAMLTTLLSHGDAYCTLDLPYQAFRRQARDAAFQAGFLTQALVQRRALIGQARVHSEAGKQQLSMQIMDVTPEAIDAALRAAGVHHLVHGHTHRPAHHRFLLDGTDAHRWVLPDWDFDLRPVRGAALRWDGATLRVMDIE